MFLQKWFCWSTARVYLDSSAHSRQRYIGHISGSSWSIRIDVVIYPIHNKFWLPFPHFLHSSLFHPDYIHIYVYVYTSLRIVRFEDSRNISWGRVSIRNFPDSMAALRFEGGRGMKINSRGQDSFFKAFTSKPYLTNIERSHWHTYIHTYESVLCFYFRPPIISC